MSYKEFQNETEHERSNDNQGRRPSDYYNSAKIFLWANVILLVGLLIYGYLQA